VAKILFCPECFNDEYFKEVNDFENHEIRGEIYKTKVKKYICNKCGEEIIEDEEFDKSLLNAFNLYRKKHNMLMPGEIKEIRNLYGLSQRALTRVLGWGDITIHRYEAGTLQDKVHDQLLKLLKNPETMIEILEENKCNLKKKEYDEVKQKAKKLLLHQNKIIKTLQTINPIFTGNKTFDLNKFANIVVYFAQNINNLWKTKLLKLIFYAEFYNFKITSESISGTPFIHWPHGPVPYEINELLYLLSHKLNVIELKEEIAYDYAGDIVLNKTNFYENIFTSEEKETLNFILNKFKDSTSTQLRNLTHEEKAYIETNLEELIPYFYAKELSL
jgi:putative zinc finger/helix-turn-helix YgiT family protein